MVSRTKFTFHNTLVASNTAFEIFAVKKKCDIYIWLTILSQCCEWRKISSKEKMPFCAFTWFSHTPNLGLLHSVVLAVAERSLFFATQSIYIRYGSNVFWGPKHIPWAHSEAVTRPPTFSTAKTPSPSVNSCLFCRFSSYFYLQHGLGQKLVNTCWLKFWRV